MKKVITTIIAVAGIIVAYVFHHFNEKNLSIEEKIDLMCGYDLVAEVHIEKDEK